MEVRVDTIAKLPVVARQLLDAHAGKRKFAFYGTMGAGKTTFIRALCKELHCIDDVTSPSFAIVNVYHTQTANNIYHIDCYRIKSIQEMIDLGYEDYLFDDHYCFIEWPELIEPLLDDEIVRVKISLISEKERVFDF